MAWATCSECNKDYIESQHEECPRCESTESMWAKDPPDFYGIVYRTMGVQGGFATQCSVLAEVAKRAFDEGARRREWVELRLDSMAKRAPLYAVTQEAFCVQLEMMLEIYGVDPDKIRMQLGVYLLSNAINETAALPIDEAWAAKAVLRARKLMDEHVDACR